MLGFTAEERRMALRYARNGADFMFIPSSDLCHLIVLGGPETIEINHVLIQILLTRKPIRLDTNTVIKYCEGTLDSKNAWLLDHGDIKVVSPKYKKPEIVKPKEDSSENNLEESKDG